MTNIFQPHASLLDVVNKFNAQSQVIPICRSHHQFLAAIPAHMPYLSGFEFHLVALNQPCDTLVCFLTRNLPRFSRIQVDVNFRSNHLIQAQHTANLLLVSPGLLCLTDHVWFELDALPDESVSLFIGNHSKKHSVDDHELILSHSKVFTSN